MFLLLSGPLCDTTDDRRFRLILVQLTNYKYNDVSNKLLRVNTGVDTSRCPTLTHNCECLLHHDYDTRYSFLSSVVSLVSVYYGILCRSLKNRINNETKTTFPFFLDYTWCLHPHLTLFLPSFPVEKSLYPRVRPTLPIPTLRFTGRHWAPLSVRVLSTVRH